MSPLRFSLIVFLSIKQQENKMQFLLHSLLLVNLTLFHCKSIQILLLCRDALWLGASRAKEQRGAASEFKVPENYHVAVYWTPHACYVDFYLLDYPHVKPVHVHNVLSISLSGE